MARGKIVLEAARLAEFLQLPPAWEVQALYANPDTGRLTIIVQGDFAPAAGQGVPAYQNVRYLVADWQEKREDEDSPWFLHIDWQPERPRKPKEKQTNAE